MRTLIWCDTHTLSSYIFVACIARWHHSARKTVDPSCSVTFFNRVFLVLLPVMHSTFVSKYASNASWQCTLLREASYFLRRGKCLRRLKIVCKMFSKSTSVFSIQWKVMSAFYTNFKAYPNWQNLCA